MPELPEVETIKSFLAPNLEEAKITKLILRRKNLRFDFPKSFQKNLEGQKITQIKRRAKYLLFELSNGATLISHLGMSGNFRIKNENLDNLTLKKHDHVIMSLINKQGKDLTLLYYDPRRFGFMDISFDIKNNKFITKLGIEPFDEIFNASYLAQKFKGRNSSIKSALLDQQIVAGLGNIYVCEALYRSGIHPITKVKNLVTKEDLPTKKLELLVPSIIAILKEAIIAGGSTLKDFSNANGEKGYFQHSFDVYGRNNKECKSKNCSNKITKIEQSNRSSFFCDKCQT